MQAWRDRYDLLRDRLESSGLPWDDEAERGAIGALLLAPQKHAVRMARRAWKEHFYDPGHGWLWSRLTYWLTQRKVDFDSRLMVEAWLTRERIAERFREYYQGSAAKEITSCLNAGLWWHGNYYVDRILEAAKARARIERATEELHEAIESARKWNA